ncbi:hypothetical protein [Ferrovibrio sp.]
MTSLPDGAGQKMEDAGKVITSPEIVRKAGDKLSFDSVRVAGTGPEIVN